MARRSLVDPAGDFLSSHFLELCHRLGIGGDLDCIFDHDPQVKIVLGAEFNAQIVGQNAEFGRWEIRGSVLEISVCHGNSPLHAGSIAALFRD